MQRVHKFESEPLIPGLPDDLGLSCLLRLPVAFHPTGRSVSRRWYNVLRDHSRFFTLRKQMGIKDSWLVVFSFHNHSGKIHWNVFDLVHFSWHSIPVMSCMENVCTRGTRCVSVPENGSIMVCEGELVSKFDIVSNCWRVMKKMNTPRTFFASGVIDGKVYVAGGKSSDGFELNSGEVMDPKQGLWRPIANMATSMAAYDAVVMDEKLFVTEGWLWPFYSVPKGQVYDPKTDKWECLATGLCEGWTGSGVLMFGHLFVVSEHERTKVKVYNSRSDTWETVKGSALPEQIRKPFVVNGCNGKIFVIGKNLNVAVGFIYGSNKNSTHTKLEFFIEWQVIEAPPSFWDLTPSNAQVIFE